MGRRHLFSQGARHVIPGTEPFPSRRAFGAGLVVPADAGGADPRAAHARKRRRQRQPRTAGPRRRSWWPGIRVVDAAPWGTRSMSPDTMSLYERLGRRDGI